MFKKEEMLNKKSSLKNCLPSKEKLKKEFEYQCGFSLSELTSLDRFIKLVYRPTDPASLGVARALFGLCMVLDVVDERGLSDIDLKWGDPYLCHFPLIHGMKALNLAWMTVLYSFMWIGAFGIMLGFCFKLSCACFVIPYWYIILLDKSTWNNHSYLYGVVGLLFWGTGANRYFAIDQIISNEKYTTVPLWNYFILRFQFFILYFLAGLKKSSREWLEGYSMSNLSQHWVFDPFKILLTPEQTDYLIVHWFAFIFDLTVGFFMFFDKTRLPAMVFCAAFHLMNARLFSIGMFPYVCLATMPLFCHVNWPRKFLNILSDKNNENKIDTEEKPILDDDKSKLIEKPLKKKQKLKVEFKKSTIKEKFVISLLMIHVFLQFFLPYSHFITKGYNNWVPGLYGYSWDMMVHSWDTILTVVRVHDNENNEDHFIDPQAWVQNDKWSKHGDMVIQYAQCLKDNLLRKKNYILNSGESIQNIDEWSRLSENLSIFIDVRCSLNGRFQQRVFNPNVDMLTVDWHPFKPVSFLMPLLTQFSSYRNKMDEITQHVYTWSNYTDVFFVADYPAMQMENYFNQDFSNITLTVLEGEILFTIDDTLDKIRLSKGQSVAVVAGKLHQVTTTSLYPSNFMYTYTNQTRELLEINGFPEPPKKRPGFPILKEIKSKVDAWWRTLGHIADAFFYLAYDVPIIRRIPKTPYYYDNY